MKWQAIDPNTVENPQAYLARMMTRRCLDHMKSARVRRETYVGPWLPEPIIDSDALAADALTEYARDITLALMLALERLSPLERAAFLLHDVFDLEYSEIAEALGRDTSACRKLAGRGRQRVRDERPRYPTSNDEVTRILQAFQRATVAGDVSALKRVLADDVVLYTDGGGRVSAATKPIYGHDKVARFFIGVTKKGTLGEVSYRLSHINGLPGVIVERSKTPIQTIAFEFSGAHIFRIYSVRNPDKLVKVKAQ